VTFSFVCLRQGQNNVGSLVHRGLVLSKEDSDAKLKQEHRKDNSLNQYFRVWIRIGSKRSKRASKQGTNAARRQIIIGKYPVPVRLIFIKSLHLICLYPGSAIIFKAGMGSVFT
jgi:hypothetical protein